MDEATKQAQSLGLLNLLKGLVKYKASDLHVKPGRPPLYRVNGNMIPAQMAALGMDDVKNLAYSVMNSKQIMQFEKDQELDFGFVAPGVARFRANVFVQRGMISFVIRMVPLSVPLLDSLGLPSVVSELAMKERGLLLVTGATGSGKSTTMAAMIEHVNRSQRNHIITIEDPIEYVYDDKLSTVSQRELGSDTSSFARALKASLRQDPDVIVVGELRDYETMQTALTAAETGHLVISTLHTNNCAQSLDRILDSIPADARGQARMQLAGCVVGILNQRLVNRADGKGRVVACEVLVRSPTIEKLILDNKISEIESAMESSNAYYKMQSMNQALEKLVRANIITIEEAISHSDKSEDLRLKLSGMISGGQKGIEASQIMDQSKPEATSGDVPELTQTELVAPNVAVQAPAGAKAPVPEVDSSGLQMENGPLHKQDGISKAVTNASAARRPNRRTA